MEKRTTEFRLPAEWEEHEATWIGFPHNKEDWPGKFAPIQWVYAEIIRLISKGEKVKIFVQDKKHQKKVEAIIKSVDVEPDQIEYHKFETDRGWLRDSSPVFVLDQQNERELIHFKFNGWAKYKNHKKDQRIPKYISKKLNLNRKKAVFNKRHVVLEGGAFDHNGEGTLITTEECLLDQETQTRNPRYTKSHYDKIFYDHLGIKKTIWLNKGIIGDDTHGHVDDLCRFVNKNTVVLVMEDDPNDENYNRLMENRERLQGARTADGELINVVELPMPSPIIFKGERLPASYANFYFSNAALIVPTFNDVKDREALGILSELITDRPVIGIHSVDLVWGLGTIHCLTHEEPL